MADGGDPHQGGGGGRRSHDHPYDFPSDALQSQGGAIQLQVSPPGQRRAPPRPADGSSGDYPQLAPYETLDYDEEEQEDEEGEAKSRTRLQQGGGGGGGGDGGGVGGSSSSSLLRPGGGRVRTDGTVRASVCAHAGLSAKDAPCPFCLTF